MTYLLDTNVISELRKPRPDPRVVSWFDGTDPRELRISVLVLGEIRHGIERLRERSPTRAAALDVWLADLRDLFADHIAPVSDQAADEWGRISAGQPLPVVDSLLAATALTNDWTLVSRNTRDLARTGVRLLDPFR